MAFSSLTFLFLFLPTVLLLNVLTPARFRNTTLLLASLFFYAWGETVFVLLMLASIGVNYLAGLALGEVELRGDRGRGVPTPEKRLSCRRSGAEPCAEAAPRLSGAALP
jgi:hypothetical protein